MADKIRPLKIETPDDGTQDDMGYPTEVNPDEDYVAAKGVAFENLDTHIIDLVDGEITLTDPSNGQRKLSRLVHPLINNTATTNPTSANDSTQGYEIGSTWINTITDAAYTCVSAAAGNAIWKITTSGGVSIKDENSLVANTPHNIINFTGDDVEVSGAGSNQVNVQIDSGFRPFIKNILANTIEIEALKQSETSGIISYFVDSFDDDDEIDASSTNFSVQDGYVSLQQGGNFTLTTTTKAQWDGGTFSGTQSFNDVGGNGAVRKEALIIGGVVTAEDFENISNITTSTSGTTTLSQSTLIETVYEGSNSLEVALDFSDSSLTETSNTEIDLTTVDVSNDKFLNIYYLKDWSDEVDFEVELEDTTGNTFTYSGLTLSQDSSYQQIQIDLTSSFASITETALQYIRLILDENAADQELVDVTGQLDDDSITLDNSQSYYQTFQISENANVDRILLRVRWVGGQPDRPLDIELQNSGGTAIATAVLQPTDASGTWAEYTIFFGLPVSLTALTTYRIGLSSDEASFPPGESNPWEVHIDTTNSYANGELFESDGTGTGDDLHFTLYKQAVEDSIYFDGFEFEAESTFETTGSYLSDEINLGVIPDALDELRWTETGTEDDVEIRIRVASTQGGLTTATWSSYFTDPTGSDLGALTPNQWLQFEIRWINGGSTASNVVKDVEIDYSVSPGTGSATVISEVANTSAVPENFVMVWEDLKGTGTINYSISRDGKSNWQSVLETENGDQIEFTTASGTSINLRAIISGNAQLYSWGVACDEEFI